MYEKSEGAPIGGLGTSTPNVDETSRKLILQKGVLRAFGKLAKFQPTLYLP